MINPTACECLEPGWCARHQVPKGRLAWLACQRGQAQFEMWDRGPLASPPTPPQPLSRCPERGLDVLDRVPCELCGNRSTMVPVFSCGLHGQCTERRFGNRSEASRTIAACSTCTDYSPGVDVRQTQSQQF